jgi:hypothetical protein
MEWTKRGTSLVIFAVVIVTISAFAVCLRFISRGYLVRKLGLTDWCILLTLFSNIANTITIVFHVSAGLGRHFDELKVYQKQEYLKVSLASAALLISRLLTIIMLDNNRSCSPPSLSTV